MGDKHESPHFLQDCSISSRRGTGVHWRDHSLAPDRPDCLGRAHLIPCCYSLFCQKLLLFSPCQDNWPYQNPSSSKYQLHQMAQLKGLKTSALVTSDAHKIWGRGKKGTAKYIALGMTKEKKCWEKETECWCSRTLWRSVLFQDLPRLLLSCFSLTDGSGDRMLRNVRSQCIAHVEDSTKTEPLFPSLIKVL